MKIYIDGVLQSPTLTASGTLEVNRDTFIATNADAFFQDPPVYANQFKGLIDEPRIFNRALTAAEIRALMLNYDPGEF